MNRKLCLLVTIAILFVSFLAIKSQQGMESKSLIPKMEAITLLGIFPKDQTVDPGEMAKISVALIGPAETLSGISMRIYGTGNIEPVIEPLPSAINSGWRVAVKEFKYDPALGKTMIDLSLVYPETNGFAFTGNLPLTEISFIANNKGNNMFTFDKAQTMVITKANEKFPVDLGEARVYVKK